MRLYAVIRSVYSEEKGRFVFDRVIRRVYACDYLRAFRYMRKLIESRVIDVATNEIITVDTSKALRRAAVETGLVEDLRCRSVIGLFNPDGTLRESA